MSLARPSIVAALAVVLVASCKAKPQPKQAAFVPVLAQLAANPKALKPKTTSEAKDASTFTFDDAPGARKVQVVVAKDRPKAWRLSFESTGEKLTPFHFAPKVDYGAMTHVDMPMPEWSEVTDGDLKGNVIHLPGYKSEQCVSAEVFSPDFFLSTAFAAQEPAMVRWACESGRASTKGAVTVSDFLDRCKDAVRAKLAVPNSADFHSVGIAHEVRTAADCTHAWSSDVTSKNAFGVELNHNFICTSNKAGAVVSSITK